MAESHTLAKEVETQGFHFGMHVVFMYKIMTSNHSARK